VKGQWAIEDDVFVDLLAYLEPGYTCPGHTFFTGEIEAKHNEAAIKFASLLSDVAFLTARLIRGPVWLLTIIVKT